ncbi:unnamed protein product [Penicillium salamii]|uniref:Major facilitator superfamily (MFS) profile domain-containing protein n=1 Tax=Penicillium salamii TaxID=1612424 RepID=A0A9W4ND10_9EURO|nr:unnamed protein product [Penicillium salamii]CAG8042821.1 unnamed protein product [Penicillium salamii]CAG8339908.1 unnamed protein product [Penicillium salamii]CAG8340046.1 unnamed protein product [Penicillium salamii]CAG8344839.1 unnamed protein product [Penicillium salamii]
MGSSPHVQESGQSPEYRDDTRFSHSVLTDHADSPSIDSDSDSDSDDTISEGNSPPLRGLEAAPLITDHRRFSSTGQEREYDADSVLENPEEEKPVTWSSLPKKGQLAILTFARLSEPLTQTSLQAYMFYQLKSFDPSLPDSKVSAQAGLLQGSFTAAQFITAVWWGRLADAEWMGRKRVLLIGLMGTCLSCIGFGFSRSFVSAMIFRTLGGVLNSNIGVMRTLIAEIVCEKKYQSRAFLLLPMCFNIGVIIGPILGGSLADPVNSFPQIFGPGSLIGGKEGVWWMQRWPYALPNVLSAIFIFASVLAVFLGLDETHETARYKKDWGRKLGKRLTRAFRRRPPHYRPLTRSRDDDSVYLDGSVETWSVPSSPARSRVQPRVHKRPGFRQIWTRNVLLTLLANFLLAFHTSAFNSMTFVFLPAPRAPEDSRQGFFHFGGGLGLPSSRVGLATAVIGFIGLPLQIFLYPQIQTKLGTLTSFRTFLPFSPLSYMLMPFLVILPRIPSVVWPAFTFVVSLQVISRTFILPAAIILVNNCVTDASVLGTVHGVAQSISSAGRTLGPLLGGWGLGLGLEYNMIGAVWWALAAQALVGWAMLWSIYEGNGIEQKKDEDED